MKLDFEIAVDRQAKAHDQTFEEVADSGCLRDSHALIWSILGSILPNHLNMLKTVLLGALLVATSLLNTYTKFFFIYQNRIKIGRVMSKILYAHIWTYATNIIDLGT